MTTGYDVGKRRLDDLDRMALRAGLTEPYDKQVWCNIGSGESNLSVALASIGHRVYNYDIRDLSVYYALYAERGMRLYFMQIDVAQMKKHVIPEQSNGVVVQRILHYLPYDAAVKLLELLVGRLGEGGMLFASFSGLDSVLGEAYEAREKKVTERWGNLSEVNQEKFAIEQELCLYREDEVRELFDSMEGVEIEELWSSQFSNIKVVVRKTSA